MKYKKINQYQEIRIETLEEIYQTIIERDLFYNLPRCVNEYGDILQTFYRGQSNCEWEISPSILRSKIKESNILQNFKTSKEMSLFGIIAYIQHYHTGTRFIDFTTNPDVAIYFACSDNNDKDGAVFLYDYIPHRAEWYTAMVLCELVRLKTNDKITIQYLSEQILKKYPEWSERFPEINEMNGSIISFLDHGMMVLPDVQSLRENLRLQRQEGCFYVCGVEFDSEVISSDRWFSRAGRKQFFPHSAVVPDDLKNGHTLVKIVIPKEIKQSILECLSKKGITYDYLFPE